MYLSYIPQLTRPKPIKVTILSFNKVDSAIKPIIDFKYKTKVDNMLYPVVDSKCFKYYPI